MSNAASAAPAVATTPAVSFIPARFTKLDAAGQPLPADASEWAAVNVQTGDLNFDVLAGNVGGGELDHAEAIVACQAITALGSSDWRLPILQEIEALRDLTRYRPAVDPAFFPDIKSSWYWSASPAASSPDDYAWFVHFGRGASGWGRRDGYAFVRAVRSASSPRQ